MARIRPVTSDALHGSLSAATLAWYPDAPTGSLTDYSVKNGVFHLLEQGRKDDAEARMLDLHFMAEFADAWPTVVAPLSAWRAVGIDKARSGFTAAAEGLPAPDDAGDLPDAAGTVGSFLSDAGLYEAGVLLVEWVLSVRDRTLGPEHPSTLISVNNLGGLYESQGRYAAAEPLYLRALESMERTLGPEHPHTLTSVGNLGWLYESQGRYAEAEPLLVRDLEASVRTLGPEHPDTLISVNNLGWFRLENAAVSSPADFDRLLEHWTNPADWLHHWARLGLALCAARAANNYAMAESVLADLTALLGDDHDRLAKGREKIALIRQKTQES